MLLLFRIWLLFQLLIQVIELVDGHGFILDPIGRASAWRKQFKTPEDFDDDGLFCGGFNAQWGDSNNGKCGVCGDAFEGPRTHEVGGKFVTKPPTIVQTYEQGDIVNVTVNLTANHGGIFVFQLCPVDDPEKDATEECLNEHNLEIVRQSPALSGPPHRQVDLNSIDNDPVDDENESGDSYESLESLEIVNQIAGLESNTIETRKRINLFNPVDLNDHTYDKYKYNVAMESPRSYTVQVKLPNENNCKRCVFRWIYITGNTWSLCGNTNAGRTGCGKQEEFRNCADIQIH